MTELLTLIVKKITSRPEEVEITLNETEHEINARIALAQEDAGGVIGKKGHIIRAIRRLAGVVAYKLGKKISIDVAPHDIS